MGLEIESAVEISESSYFGPQVVPIDRWDDVFCEVIAAETPWAEKSVGNSRFQSLGITNVG